MSLSLRTALALVICTLMGASVAHAQATRTWVSGVGDDANPCSRTAPCKTFAGAISKTAANGEIDALDSGGFGQVSITKSITIDGHGTIASILASGNGIVVNGADVIVMLRNISLIAIPVPPTPGVVWTGVLLNNGAAVILDHVTISGFDDAVATSLTNPTVGGGHVTVMNSALMKNRGVAIHAQSGSITVENSSLTNNGVAVQAEAGANVRLTNNDVFNNLTGFACGAGVVSSAANNRKGNNVGGAVPPCAPTGTITVQ